MRFNLSTKIKLKLIKIGFFLALALWLIGFSSPCIDSSFLRSLFPIQKQFYSVVCHQEIERSFECGNFHLLVCARCTGTYLGSAIASFIIIFFGKPIKVKTKWLIFFSLPMLLDVLLLTFGIYDYNKSASSITGLLFGSIVFIYILSAIENLLLQKNNL